MLPSNGTPAQGATAEPGRRAPGEAAATQPGRVRPGGAAVQTTPETARRPAVLSAGKRAELQEAAAGGFAEDHAGMSYQQSEPLGTVASGEDDEDWPVVE